MCIAWENLPILCREREAICKNTVRDRERENNGYVPKSLICSEAEMTKLHLLSNDRKKRVIKGEETVTIRVGTTPPPWCHPRPVELDERLCRGVTYRGRLARGDQLM